MKPGLYSVKVGQFAATFAAMRTPDKSLPTSICLTTEDIGDWPEKAMEQAWNAAACDTYDYERQLNDVSGRISCSGFTKDGGGSHQLV